MRPGLVASHLLIEQDQAVFIDVGAATALPVLLAALQSLGLKREQVVAVIVTHVHLDHAGCAGSLLECLPNANLLVHPRGARHLIDPSRLVAGATAVYGQALMQERFGNIKPVPESRVITVDEIFRFRLGSSPAPRELHFIDTPGHAAHHCCVYDSQSRGIFSGDSFGLSYREVDTRQGPFIFPSTSPVQFDPVASHASIDKLLSFNPSCFYLTHFGRVAHPQTLAVALHRRIDLFVEQVRAVSRFESQERLAALIQQLENLLIAELHAHGCILPREKLLAVLGMDIELNAKGLLCWQEKAESAKIQ